MPKTSSQLSAFMNLTRLATFVTVDRRGRPHAVPVFFTYGDGKIYVQTNRKSVKVSNLRWNSNAAVSVHSDEEAVVIRGIGRIVEDRSEFVNRTKEHVEKYNLRLDEEGRDGMGIPLFDEDVRCVIEVSPKKVLFW